MNPEAAQKVRSAPFQEMQVAGMVDDARKIGVFVIDALQEMMLIPLQPARKRFRQQSLHQQQ